jgi:hypothetical protein
LRVGNIMLLIGDIFRHFNGKKIADSLVDSAFDLEEREAG